jgi:hypothetical protein
MRNVVLMCIVAMMNMYYPTTSFIIGVRNSASNSVKRSMCASEYHLYHEYNHFLNKTQQALYNNYIDFGKFLSLNLSSSDNTTRSQI